MADSKNDKKKIWIYAVILFTSAFIVLLITAYSQIKLNKSLNNYKGRLDLESKQKSGFELNLSSAQKQNEELNKQLGSLNSEISKFEDEKQTNKDKYSKLEKEYNKAVSSYNALITAKNEYGKGNIIKCALVLKSQCEEKYLEKVALVEYQTLLDETIRRASSQLYYKGLMEYKEKEYIDAISDFQNSVYLVTDEYYSDDCLYLIAYANYFLDQKDVAKNSLFSLLSKYPDSTLRDDVSDLLRVISR